ERVGIEADRRAVVEGLGDIVHVRIDGELVIEVFTRLMEIEIVAAEFVSGFYAAGVGVGIGEIGLGDIGTAGEAYRVGEVLAGLVEFGDVIGGAVDLGTPA